MRHVHTISFGLAGLFFTAHALGADLKDIYNLAAGSDPQIQQAEAGNRAAREADTQTFSRFLPQVSAGASIGKSDSSALTTDNVTSTGYSLTLTQSVYNRANYVQRNLAKSSIKQADVELQAARQDLIGRVAKAYFEVLAAVDSQAFAKAEKESIARQLDQTRQRFKVGLVAITDVHESQARFDLATAQAIAADVQVDATREALRELIGRYPDTLAKLTDNMPLVNPEPNDIEQWTKAALEQNPALLSAQQAAQQAQENVSLARSDRFPRLNASASYSKNDADSVSTDTTSVGLNLNVDLFSGFAVSSRIRQAQEYKVQADQILEQQRRATQRQVRNAFLGVQAGISRVTALKQAVVSSESALKATEAGYEVGTRTTVDVLDSRRELFRAQRDYAQSRYNYILDTLNLKQAAGSLALDDLQKINGWLK
jgi:outer membrane protein